MRAKARFTVAFGLATVALAGWAAIDTASTEEQFDVYPDFFQVQDRQQHHYPGPCKLQRFRPRRGHPAVQLWPHGHAQEAGAEPIRRHRVRAYQHPLPSAWGTRPAALGLLLSSWRNAAVYVHRQRQQRYVGALLHCQRRPSAAAPIRSARRSSGLARSLEAGCLAGDETVAIESGDRHHLASPPNSAVSQATSSLEAGTLASNACDLMAVPIGCGRSLVASQAWSFARSSLLDENCRSSLGMPLMYCSASGQT